MLTEHQVIKASGCSSEELDQLVDYPLIARQQVSASAESGDRFEYANDTIDRLIVVTFVDRHGLPLSVAAEELFLQGYELPPRVVAECLNQYIDRMLHTSSLQQRRRTLDELPPTKKQLGRRILNRVYDLGAHAAFHDALRISVYGAQGKLPGTLTLTQHSPVQVPGVVENNRYWADHTRLWDYRRLREVLVCTPDDILMAAVDESREYLSQVADAYVAQFVRPGFSADDFVRSQLPGYPLRVGHSAAQAMLPFLVLYRIDPLSRDTKSVANANAVFLNTLAYALDDIAAHFSTQST